MREKERNMSVMKWILNLTKEGNFETLTEQTSCLTSNDHGPNFLSNTFVSCCQRVLFHSWDFSVSLLLLQNRCRWLSGLYSFNWQTYLSSAGLDRNISHSEAAPVEDGSPRKFEYISFKGPACHPLTVPSNLLLPGGFYFQLKHGILALLENVSNFYVLILYFVNKNINNFCLFW